MCPVNRTFAVGAVLITTLGGCSEYLDRRDTLFLGAGNAVETNINTHRIDPWPKHAQNTNIPTFGARGATAVRIVRCGVDEPPRGTTVSNTTSSSSSGGGQSSTVSGPAAPTIRSC